jgi:hypothetical protein
MAAREIKLKVSINWRWESADGQKCEACGDPAWLRCLRLYAAFNNGAMLKQQIVLCQSCGEEYKRDA